VALAQAWQKHEQANRLLIDDIDPAKPRRLNQIASRNDPTADFWLDRK